VQMQKVAAKPALAKQASRTEKSQEERALKLKHKEAKEAAVAARYAADEEVVAQHLAQLIGDAEWLKSFLADVLRTQAEAYQVLSCMPMLSVFGMYVCGLWSLTLCAKIASLKWLPTTPSLSHSV
jgi:hypothetical protein